MYDIRQFKPALYVLLVLGLTGFALAAQWPGVWMLSVTSIAFNAWLVKRGKFRPMPRLLANLVTILATLYIVLQVRTQFSSPILHIGLFLVLLQIIKVYEQRANRDYAQLLVLSLLLIVAAAISTPSLIFGIIFIFYLFLSLYCCLLFHLKVETDQAKSAMALPDDRVDPITLRQDQKFLARSMRRLTGLISTVSICSAVFAFLFIPRGPGAGILGQLQFKPSQTLTGFRDNVTFESLARITQSEEIAAYAQVWKNEKPVDGSMTLMLRGITLDVYHGANSSGQRWRWTRSPSVSSDDGVRQIGPDMPEQLVAVKGDEPRWRQKIKLFPTGTKVLFAMEGPNTIMSRRDMRLQFSPRDRVIQTDDRIITPIEYEVISTNQPVQESTRGFFDTLRGGRFGTPTEQIDPQVTAYAKRDDVSGGFASQRTAQRGQADKVDEQIAHAIEHHLRTTFRYTLDLKDSEKLGRDEDPMVAFLYRFKQGHCEYFAGAMTLMCQSLGMTARMVVGFKCDEFNNVGGYYLVKQSHAHAWVEVLTTDGWKTFDPTSGRDGDSPAKPSMWRRISHFFDFLEYTWANSVIAYDNENRKNLLENLETSLTNTAINTSVPISGMKKNVMDTVSNIGNFVVSPSLLTWLLKVMVALLLGVIVYFVIERWRLRRRAFRIGLDALPVSDQHRLARQLIFYDDMLLLLEKHNIRPPRHQTPKEFSNSLTFLPAEVYDTIRRLTEVFYKIRFGTAELSGAQQRRLVNVINRMAAAMSNGHGKADVFRIE